jgi:DNA-binding MarR family transcriptional regulator
MFRRRHRGTWAEGACGPERRGVLKDLGLTYMSDHYLEVISLIERLHRQFLEVVKLELDSMRVDDVNSVQALLLFNMGNADISAGELISRGYYLGSNVSYNVKKLAKSDYLKYERSEHDRRSTRVRLTRKGSALRNRLSVMLSRHIEMLGQSQVTDTDLETIVTTLRRLERFWMLPDVRR